MIYDNKGSIFNEITLYYTDDEQRHAFPELCRPYTIQPTI